MFEKTTNGDVTSFLWNGNHIIAELITNNSQLITNLYVWVNGEILCANLDGETVFYCHDANKNITDLVDDTGTHLVHYDYSPFGVQSSTVYSSSFTVSLNPFGFSSEYFDETTGFVEYKYRPYLPPLGKFLSLDPIGIQGGINEYGICGNDLINKFDLWGLRDPLGEWLRYTYVDRFSESLLNGVFGASDLTSYQHNAYTIDASTRGWDKYLNEDTVTIQTLMLKYYIGRKVRRMYPRWGSERFSINLNEQMWYFAGLRLALWDKPNDAEDDFITDNYDYNRRYDLSFWLGRPHYVKVRGTVDVCMASKNTWLLKDYDLEYEWFDKIDANPTANDVKTLERRVLPVTEFFMGNDYDVTVLWKNSGEIEKQDGFTKFLTKRMSLQW